MKEDGLFVGSQACRKDFFIVKWIGELNSETIILFEEWVIRICFYKILSVIEQGVLEQGVLSYTFYPDRFSGTKNIILWRIRTQKIT